jgi:hypothetical protein
MLPSRSDIGISIWVVVGITVIVRTRSQLVRVALEGYSDHEKRKSSNPAASEPDLSGRLKVAGGVRVERSGLVRVTRKERIH